MAKRKLNEAAEGGSMFFFNDTSDWERYLANHDPSGYHKMDNLEDLAKEKIQDQIEEEKSDAKINQAVGEGPKGNLSIGQQKYLDTNGDGRVDFMAEGTFYSENMDIDEMLSEMERECMVSSNDLNHDPNNLEKNKKEKRVNNNGEFQKTNKLHDYTVIMDECVDLDNLESFEDDEDF
jgi:hypothetical protein